MARISGEGDSPRASMFGICEAAPHPNPLPAKSGEREKWSIAAAAQPKLIPL
jgi:hypothetical protein